MHLGGELDWHSCLAFDTQQHRGKKKKKERKGVNSSAVLMGYYNNGAHGFLLLKNRYSSEFKHVK